ncbi:MAG TPA: hypothetical protein H9812_04860 [Candidatus Gallimonas intestinigallinarum]|uniref:Uncharacterized protein n=1 Tax=Candidatus Gallimonas intestinigallinarum TaxID=2838604 RepID=A0A9D2DWY8_9FIRM|nr:hypothetical protein [Candidatus Gallimonas intestinigallinarum]
MKKTTKVAAVALAAALSSTLLAGCDITTDVSKDYAQVIAEVNITDSANFESSSYAEYGDVIGTTEITKRDMVAYFISTGYSMMESYGWTYYDTFNMISETLVNRQIYIQYAMLYLLDDESESDITVAGYEAAVEGQTGIDRRLAALAYFLDEEEEAQALYSTRQLVNNTLDSQEETYLDHDHSHDDSASTARTTPTGIDTETEDYYNEAYRIYTGSNALADCPGYEAPEGSTPTTRRKAYSSFLASLRANSLIESGEDLSNVESLTYFKTELASAYETAIINKLTDKFEDTIRATVNEQYAQEIYDTTYSRQETTFANDTDSFETALEGVSDTSFVLTAPEANYGYVINILIPFSTSQSLELENAPADLGDTKGNNFLQRAALLKNVRGTDQRGTWFDEDYAFDGAETENAYTGGNAARSYLFFEDSLGGNEQYERVPNYLGYYTYNGTVRQNDDESYTVRPNRITIDKFIAEMEGYLTQAANEVSVEDDGYTVSEGVYVNGIAADDTINAVADNTTYYNRSVSDYYTESGAVDYSKFVYYAGQVNFTNGFDANQFFLAGSAENVAYSVMNELSFAYNTDTEGLNDYFGYVISTGATDYVPEFEYAAQYVCRQGAGSYVVVPSDYGWHVIYCTFSFVADEEGNVIAPYTFNWDDRATEGTFSYLFYEALCADLVSEYASIRQSNAIEDFKDCAVVYEDRYADLSGLDTAN